MLVSGESPTSLESPRQETLLDRAFAGEGQRRQRRQRRRPREHGRSRLTLGYRGHVPGPGPQLQGGNMWAPLESPDRTQSALPAAAGVVAASPPTCDAVAKLSGADSRHFGTERAAGAFSDDEEGAPAQSPTWTVGAQAGGAPAGSMGPDGTGEQGRDGEAAEVQGPATLRRQELSLGERIERSHGINAGTGGRAPSPRTRAPVERHAQPRRLQRPRSGHGFRGFAAHMAAALGECAAAGAADGEGDDAAAVVGNGRSMTPPHCAQTPAAQLQLMGQNAGGATLQGRVHAVRSAPGDDGVGGGCGGGESFPRVDWVAVPEALRARRVNRRRRRRRPHDGDARAAAFRARAEGGHDELAATDRRRWWERGRSRGGVSCWRGNERCGVRMGGGAGRLAGWRGDDGCEAADVPWCAASCSSSPTPERVWRPELRLLRAGSGGCRAEPPAVAAAGAASSARPRFVDTGGGVRTFPASQLSPFCAVLFVLFFGWDCTCSWVVASILGGGLTGGGVRAGATTRQGVAVGRPSSELLPALAPPRLPTPAAAAAAAVSQMAVMQGAGGGELISQRRWRELPPSSAAHSSRRGLVRQQQGRGRQQQQQPSLRELRSSSRPRSSQGARFALGLSQGSTGVVGAVAVCC
jgi:hypothetical protein